jgi:NADH oxidase (H2O2-forming)
VIATGSLPFVPQKGCTTNILPYGIFTLRSLADGMLFEKALETAGKVCIIGGGTIGIECAVALARRRIKTVLISRNENLLSRQFDPEIAEIIRKHLENLGVEVISGEPIVFPEKFWKEKTLQVGDTLIPADLVLLASGVKPEIFLAMEAGIEIGKAGGIVVNEMLQVKADDEFLSYIYMQAENVLK